MVHVTPDEFEHVVPDLYRAKGNWAEVVGVMGGHGGDTEVRCHGKRFIPDRWIGLGDVRDAFGAYTHDGRAAQAYLTMT